MYSGGVVNLLFVHAFLEILVHCLECEWVAIGDRIAQYGIVFSYAHEINTPGVNTDAYDRQLSFCHQLQSFDDFVVQGEDVPIEMSSCLDEAVLESGQFFKLYFTFGQCSDDCPSACGSQVHGKEISVIFHYMFFVLNSCW